MRARRDVRKTPVQALPRAVALSLISLLVAALTPLSAAQATNHKPWDQPGSAWSGTVEITNSYDRNWRSGDNTIYGIEHRDEHGRITDLRVLGGTADSSYGGHVVGSGHYAWDGDCNGSGGTQAWSRTDVDWTVDEISTESQYREEVFRIETDDSGTSRFGARWQVPTVDRTTDCYGKYSERPHYLTYVFNMGEHDHPFPILNDDDPDPLHLVGSTTWTLSNEPYPLNDYRDDYTDFRYTVTYDLRLVYSDPPECDVTKTKSKEWKAKTPIRWLPDRHWGNFKVTAKWCYDEETGYGELLSLRSKGTVDDGPLGLFARAAGIFGFETKWSDSECDPRCSDGLAEEHVSVATVTRKMTFCFNLFTLLDKLKVKQWFENKAKNRMKNRLEEFIAEHGGLGGEGFDSAVLGKLDDLIVSARGKIDRVDEVLRDKHVPNFIAEWLEDQVEDPFAALMQRWKDDVAEALYRGDYDGLAAEAASELMIEAALDPILGLGQVCDPVDFAVDGYDHPGLLTLWQPQVTANVYDRGRKLQLMRDDLYMHPSFEIETVKN